jgi:glycosyltransferase involved in cell wall biosynthesis
MKISYLICCHNETDTLTRLLNTIYEVLTLELDSEQNSSTKHQDEIVILIDSQSATPQTMDIVDVFKTRCDIRQKEYRIIKHPLDNNYGSHKNHGIEQSSGEFIFQIDGDECPPESLLGENLHSLIESNPTIEAYTVPRINDFRGVTSEHAKQWGWKLTMSPSLERPIVNFPDHQWRIFKKEFPRIGFTRKLHEKIEGYKSYVSLPPDENYALYHDKTIERQMETNISYNKRFTVEENKGHSVFR